jgi:uncharacterized membrane protein YbhN (UPF0104 family)
MLTTELQPRPDGWVTAPERIIAVPRRPTGPPLPAIPGTDVPIGAGASGDDPGAITPSSRVPDPDGWELSGGPEAGAVTPNPPAPSTALRAARRLLLSGRVRARVATLARVALSAGVLVLLVRKARPAAIWAHLSRADWHLLLLGYGFAVLSVLVTVSQWWGLLAASGLPRSYRRCLRLEIAGDALDAALPSAIGGDLVRAVRVAEHPGERVSGASAVVLRRLCNFPGMVLLLAIGLAATATLPYAARIRPVALVALVGGSALVAVMMSPLFGALARSPLCRLGPGRTIGKLFAALHDFRGRRRDLLVAAGRGVVFWCVVVASQACFIASMGIHVAIAYAVVVITTTTALTMLPISVGGYGLREGSFATFLAVAGHATAAQGAAVGVCLTLQTVGLGVIGAPVLFSLRRSGRRPLRRSLSGARLSAEAL